MSVMEGYIRFIFPKSKKRKKLRSHVSVLSQIAFAKKGEMTFDKHIVDKVVPALCDPYSVIVYIYLLRWSQEEENRGSFFSTVDFIARQLGSAKFKVLNSIEKLESYRLIEVERNSVWEFRPLTNWTFTD